MIISKSDYIKYFQCPKCLWLYKNRKDLVPDDLEGRMSGAIENGQAVERMAYGLFPDGVMVENHGFSQGLEQTSRLIMDSETTLFQASFWQNDLYCRSDIIDYDLSARAWDIYEVKSAARVKNEYIVDLAFQKLALESSGLKTGRTFVIYVNKDFIKHGEIAPCDFLITEEVSEAVNDYIEKARGDIKAMFDLVKQKEEPVVRMVKQCYEPYPCMFIPYCWRDIPEHSIYNVYLSAEEIDHLLDDGIVDLADVPTGFITKEKYQRYHEALLQDKVSIDKTAIADELKNYEYPLYFLDYETNSPGVPIFDGYRAYQRIVFQYSLHIIREPGAEPEHYEYLHDSLSDPTNELSRSLKELIGEKGSVIAWYKPFEAGCNSEMGERSPGYAEFYAGVNARLLDLMEVFAKGYYVDKKFYGSASLKKILPVLAPHLSYKELNIQEGMTASESWNALIDPSLSEEDKKDLMSDMLKYCQLDTYAMVEIYRILKELSA